MIGVLFWLCLFIIIYTYFGYLLLLSFFAQFSIPKNYAKKDFPSVTLLIAAYNEEKIIASKLENSLSLDYPKERLQIIVAADGSDDGTVATVRSYAERGVEISYDSVRRGKMAAINHAMLLAQNEIVVFSDANNFYAPNALIELVRPFSDVRVGGVSGAKTINADEDALGDTEGLYWKYESLIKKQETRLGCTVGASGEILSIRRKLFTPPPPEIINDDMFIAFSIIRAGYDMVYVPTARSFERMTFSEREEIVRRTRIFAGLYQTMRMSFSLLPFHRPVIVWQIVSHKYLRALIPFAMLGAWITNLLVLFYPQAESSLHWLFLAPPYGKLFLVLQSCFYLSAIVGKKLKLGGKLGKLLNIPVFLVNSNFAALRGFQRYLTGQQTVIWKKAAR